jgi:hypothetical protein
VKLTLTLAFLFLLALTPAAHPADGKGKAGAPSSSWTVVPAQDCDNGIGPFRELTISSDGTFVAALRHDACLWRAKDGHRIKQLDFAQPVVFAGNLLFHGDKIFDPTKLAVVGTNKLPRYGSDSRDVFAVVGPTSAAIQGFDRKVLIYDWNTKSARPFPGTGFALSSRFVVDADAWEDERPMTIRWTSIAAPSRQGSFRLSKNGEARLLHLGGDRAIFSYGMSGGIEVWQIPEGRRVAALPADTIAPVGISPDGKTMATCQHVGEPDSNDYDVIIWNVDPLRKTAKIRVKLTNLPRELMFDDTARTLVVCDDSGACVFLRSTSRR